MSEEVLARIEAAIEDHGPITFAEYMELALYGPGGYYARPPVGPSGDFVTSPHVHPIFGELLARAIRDLWTGLGSPDPLRLVEVGAGDGTLAAQVSEALADVPLSYTAVEISEGARSALAELDGIAVTDELPADADVVLANELLDNLPFRVMSAGREVRIGVRNGQLIEVAVAPDPELAEIRDGVMPIGAFRFVDHLATMLRPGYALVIDYGGVGTSGGDVHGYGAHRVVADVLRDPGTVDITSGVDFAAIARRARERGLAVYGPVTQHRALMALGFEAWVRDELAKQHEQLEASAGIDAVRTWSGRSRATILADPASLGRLRWLVLTTPGLPGPDWISSSAEG
jgi:SAM-dependent MidA family methyltransferase